VIEVMQELTEGVCNLVKKFLKVLLHRVSIHDSQGVYCTYIPCKGPQVCQCWQEVRIGVKVRNDCIAIWIRRRPVSCGDASIELLESCLLESQYSRTKSEFYLESMVPGAMWMQ